MKRKTITLVSIISVAVLLIVGVVILLLQPSKEPDNTPTPEESLPKIAEVFIEKTDAITEVTINSKDDLDLCILLYSCLEQTNADAINDERVIGALNKLNGYVASYNSLKLQEYESAKSEALVSAFIEVVSTLPKEELIMLGDLEKILIAENNYNSLSDSDKTRENVKAAKTILDSVRAKYDLISQYDQDAYNAHKFCVDVKSLPDIGELNIEHLVLIDTLEINYNNLTESHKASENVVSAKSVFDSYTAKVVELKASQKKAEDFIMAVFSLPTGGGLKWQDSTQKAAINDTISMYDNLSDFEKTIPGVSDSYEQLNVIKTTFDNLKEPYDIKKIETTNLCFYVPGVRKLQFVSGKDPITVLVNNYGLTEETIKDNVKIYLDVYIEAGAIVGNPLFSIDITENMNVTTADIEAKLSELKASGNEAVTSQGYSFTLHIESLNDQYASSEYSSFFCGMYMLVS